MKKIFLTILFFLPFALFSQVADDFESGNISKWQASTDGHWEADNAAPISGSYSLHHSFNSSTPSTDMISTNISAVNINAGSTNWQFQLKYSYNPSSGNKWLCFIMADTNANQMMPSGAVNGYALGVNYNTSDDTLRLWKVTNGTATELINSKLDWEDDFGKKIYGFKVSRTNTGDWSVFVDTTGGFDNLFQAGQTVNDIEFTSAKHFGFYYKYSASADKKLWVDDVSIAGASGNDEDSQVLAGADPEPSSISSMVNAAEGVQVFDVTLKDLGTSDNLPTKINKLTFSQGDNNDIADWTNVIAGAKLVGNDIADGLSGTVTANSIVFEQNNFIQIDNNSEENYKLFIWLKQDLSQINDNDNIELRLDYQSVMSDLSGSSFGSGSLESGDNNLAVQIVATLLKFENIPPVVAANSPFKLTVKATDANGNIDTDNNSTVTISKTNGTGNLSSASGLSHNLSAGIYEWQDLKYNEIGDFSIKGTSVGLTDAVADLSCQEFIYFLKDDFEDADLAGWSESTVGHWQASDEEAINGNYSLHQTFDATSSGFDKISHSLTNIQLNSDSTIWQFEVKYNRDPSSSNNWSVFLMSDANHEQMMSGGAVNAYVIGVNFKGSDDLVKLWELTDGVASEVLSTSFNWKENNFDETKSIFVARSKTGKWEIRIDANGGFDELVSYGTADHSTHTTANYFGVVYNYSSGGDKILWIDDIYVGLPIPDTKPPIVTNFTTKSSNSLQVTFNEELDKSTAENLANYSVDNSIANPSNATLNTENNRVVDLIFNDNFVDDIDYGMLIENITDLAGNKINDTIIHFSWQNLKLLTVKSVSLNKIDLLFNKNLDSTSAVTLSNYSINNELGQPQTAIYDPVNNNIVHLSFAKKFIEGQSYLLHLKKIKDQYGSEITETDIEFMFHITQGNDLVINELMIDINPAPVALPVHKYIELYNNSDFDIDLTDWTLQIGTNSKLNFPSQILQAKKYAIICSADAETSFSAYGTVIPILKESYLSSSVGKKIFIRDKNNNIIEFLKYDPKTWYNDLDKANGGWSLERIDPTNICSQDANWHASNNYIGGTPGDKNSVFGSNPDTQNPVIEDIKLITSCDAIIEFSETVDTSKACSIINYILNENVTPFDASVDVDNSSVVRLHFLEHFNFGNNELKISNISDYCENTMPDSIFSFTYKLIDVRDIEPKSETQLKVYFSEPVSEATAVNVANYTVNNDIGNPAIATRDAQDTNIVHLKFNKSFELNKSNALSISDLSDVNNYKIKDTIVNFVYHKAEAFDIVVNELMLDVSPSPNGLPAAQYIELYNTSSYDIWLSDWSIRTEKQNKRVFSDVKIKANDFIIICKKSDEKIFENMGNIAPILGTSDLNQTGKLIEIFDNINNLIYHIRYSDLWYQDENKKKGGWSLEKIDPQNFCEEANNWTASTDVSGGTPNKINSVFASNPNTNEIKAKSLTTLSSNKLQVFFSKNISLANGLDTANYTVAGIGHPKSVNLLDTSYAVVVLEFDKQFADKGKYSLKISDVSDDCGHIINNVSLDFTYFRIAPKSVWVESESQLKISFSEEVELISATDPNNYFVNNSIGKPVTVIKGSGKPNEVYLQFAMNFTDGAEYEIEIKNIEDVNKNKISDASFTFIYHVAKLRDVVINELLYNPKSGGADFVELYNRSEYSINILDLRIANRDDEGEINSPYRLSHDNYILRPKEFLTITTDTNNIKDNYNHGEKFIQLKTLPSFPDDAGTVVIYGKNDTIIDEFAYNKDMQFELLSDDDGISLERINYDLPTQDSSNWHSAAEKVGFATPSLPNSQYKEIVSNNFSGTVELEPQVFSPDNDGYNDQLYIKYNFEQSGIAATVLIFNKNGRQVREITNDEIVGTEGRWIWDGLDNNGQKVRIGIYMIVVKIFNPDGNKEVYRKTAVVAAMRN